jgi:hypothetical protein
MSKEADKLYLETRKEFHAIRDRIGISPYLSMILTEVGFMLSILDDETVEDTLEKLKLSVDRFKKGRI